MTRKDLLNLFSEIDQSLIQKRQKMRVVTLGSNYRLIEIPITMTRRILAR